MNKRSFSNHLISIILTIMLIVSVIASTKQFYLILKSSSIKKVCILMVMVLLLVLFIRTRRGFREYINSNLYYLIIVLFSFLILYQINVIQALTGTLNNDPKDIYNLIIQRPVGVKNYFSIYPNNLFLAYIEKILYLAWRQPTPLVFLFRLNVLNALLIDLGCLFIMLAVKEQEGKEYGLVALMFSIGLYGISPNVVIPYSDNWVFFGLSLFLWLLSIYIKQTKYRFITLTFIGIDGAFIYEMKPSTFIVVIALVIVSFFFLIRNRKNNEYLTRSFVCVIFATVPFMVMLGTINHVKYSNNLVKVERKQALSMLHFMAMGLHESNENGKGGYWLKFDQKDQSLIPNNRIYYETHTIKEDINRLKNPRNALEFFILKQAHNSSSASWWRTTAVNYGPIGWDLVPKLKVKNSFQSYLRKIFTQNDYIYWNGYLIYSQLLWCIVLLLTLCTFSFDDFYAQVIKYTVVGGMLFLLIFEGDNSRYLIQFLPAIIVLSTYGLKYLLNIRS